MRSWPSFLALLALGAAADAGCGTAAIKPHKPASATPEDFHTVAVGDMDGRMTPLSDVLGQRPTLVSFWAPWCEPCVEEQPALERLAQKAKECGVAVMGIAVGENRATTMAFARAHGLTFPQFIDQDFRLADALGQRRIPTTMVLDAAQKVLFVGDVLDQRAVAALTGTVRDGGSLPGCSMR
ncbi:MAG TPA: TlpA disulfide reductase family protein [Polyangia bacterium]|jgi:thiol-disulfide isomerase/thioredoxin|nr:TlpA disulfide reductase family protein [Polyangia bacterium]